MKSTLYFIVSILTLACIDVPEPHKSTDEIFVYCVINPDDEITNLTLNKLYKVNTLIPIDSGKSIENAVIKIIGDKGNLNFTYNKKNQRYESPSKGFFESENTYTLQITNGDKVYRATTTIPPKHAIQVKNIQKDNNLVTMEIGWIKVGNVPVHFTIFGQVELSSTSFGFFNFGNTAGVWKSKNTSSFYETPIGNFTFPASYSSSKVILTLKSQEPIWGEFEDNLINVQNRTSFSKNFESPLFFKFNIEGAYGIFSSFQEQQITIQINQ
ncbi:MAG: DUF4249 family protein [Leadbetterella sp.]|jgi:hypothetical protein|nr:DUF4249 family protein [Leadbetterella sp.]